MAEAQAQDRAMRPQLERAFVGASTARGEPAYVSDSRVKALGNYLDSGMPDRATHLWRYTDPTVFVPQDSAFAIPSAVDREDLKVRISSRDGEEGIRGIPFEVAGGLVKELGSVIPVEFGIFEALNMAAWSSGVIIHVPKGVNAHDPILVERQVQGDWSFARVLVLIEDGASARIYEKHTGGEERQVASTVLEGKVAPGGLLEHGLEQGLEDGVKAGYTSRVLLARDSQYMLTSLSYGGSTFKADMGAIIGGEGARSSMNCVVMAAGRRRADHHTEHVHTAPRGQSRIRFRASIDKRGSSAYTGLIKIEERARYTEAFQETRNLLLSSKARAESIPELEIENNDVVCSHGATSSPIDSAQLFYLMSRGMDRRSAAEMIVRGFVGQALDELHKSMREPFWEGIKEGFARNYLGDSR